MSENIELTKEEFKALYESMKVTDLAKHLGVGLNHLIDTAKALGLSKSTKKNKIIIKDSEE